MSKTEQRPATQRGEVINLQEQLQKDFAHLSDAQLKARMERASSETNLDDETAEFARRMSEAGKSWRWEYDWRRGEHIVIEGESQQSQ